MRYEITIKLQRSITERYKTVNMLNKLYLKDIKLETRPLPDRFI